MAFPILCLLLSFFSLSIFLSSSMRTICVAFIFSTVVTALQFFWHDVPTMVIWVCSVLFFIDFVVICMLSSIKVKSANVPESSNNKLYTPIIIFSLVLGLLLSVVVLFSEIDLASGSRLVEGEREGAVQLWNQWWIVELMGLLLIASVGIGALLMVKRGDIK